MSSELVGLGNKAFHERFFCTVVDQFSVHFFQWLFFKDKSIQELIIKGEGGHTFLLVVVVEKDGFLCSTFVRSDYVSPCGFANAFLGSAHSIIA